jgi:hypothetical protein
MRALFMVLSGGAVFFSLACGSSDETPPPSAPPGGTANAAGSGTSGGTAGQVGQGGAGASAGGQGATAGNASAGTGGTPAGGTATGGTATGGTPAGGMAAGGMATGGMATGGTGPCGTGSIFCTNFDAEAVPSQLLYYPEYERAAQTKITLDSEVVHGAGGRSLKVVGSGFSQMLGVAVPSKFWGRVYLRSATDIQMGHNTYVAAGTDATGDPNNGEYIRIGEHQCQLELNRKSDDKELLSNGGMYMCSGGVKLVKDTWYCLEFSYDGPGKEARVFVDGTEVTALHATDWGPYDYKMFKLGFEKYHGLDKTLWYDDLALATEQIHCQ